MRAYQIDRSGFDDVTQQLGIPVWSAVVGLLDFSALDSGGSCFLYAAELPGSSWQVQINDGDTDLPLSMEKFVLSLVDSQGTDIFTVVSGL
jgi:hypothetical protein